MPARLWSPAISRERQRSPVGGQEACGRPPAGFKPCMWHTHIARVPHREHSTRVKATTPWPSSVKEEWTVMRQIKLAETQSDSSWWESCSRHHSHSYAIKWSLSQLSLVGVSSCLEGEDILTTADVTQKHQVNQLPPAPLLALLLLSTSQSMSPPFATCGVRTVTATPPNSHALHDPNPQPQTSTPNLNTRVSADIPACRLDTGCSKLVFLARSLGWSVLHRPSSSPCPKP